MIGQLLHAADFIMQEAERANIRNRVVLVIGSDFARTPNYNGPTDADGKDHWPIGSMLVLGAGVRGNRVVGATDADQLARLIDPANPEKTADSSSGIKLKIAHVHEALRRFAGVDETLSQRFNLRVPTLDLI